MANLLKMTITHSILSLHAHGWSQRRIARTLQISREAVSRCVRLAAEGAGGGDSKPANAPMDPDRVGSAVVSTGVNNDSTADDVAPKPAKAPTGSERRNHAYAWREFILEKYAAGLSVVRIHQDLRELPGTEQVTYDSVRRLLKRIAPTVSELPFRRLECEPGVEAQVDFGTGISITLPNGKRRRTCVFRIVLSHSRKAYSECVYRQTTDDFLACLENAFHAFGGVPRTLIIDNLKAAVKRVDFYDPELTPKVRSFCEHYGTVILPTKPRMPRHKGKVERHIAYVQDNGLKGHTFTSLEEQNEHLQRWEAKVADTRIHGTTKRHVGQVFQQVERAALLPLPVERFPSFREAQRSVHLDGHIEVDKAYYSVPPEYVSRRVWVRWDRRLVRIYNPRWELLRSHVRQAAGRFCTHAGDVHPHKIHGLEKGVRHLLARAERIGAASHDWAQAMLQARGIAGTRVLLGLVNLVHKHPAAAVETACQKALAHGEFRLRTIRALVKRSSAASVEQTTLPFLEEHPIIRPLADYSRTLDQAFQRQEDEAASRRWRDEGFLRQDGSKARWATGTAPSQSCQSRAGLDESPGNSRATARVLPHRSDYPSSSCPSAELDSVSPDNPNVVPFPRSREDTPDA